MPQRSLENSTVLASFRFLTALAESEDPEVRDLASAGAARQLLYGRALDAFEELIRLWGVDIWPLT